LMSSRAKTYPDFNSYLNWPAEGASTIH
jgi:hypothetical protein